MHGIKDDDPGHRLCAFKSFLLLFKSIAFFIMNSHDEKELLRRLAEGDQKALTAIYQQFWQPLFIAAYNIIKDKKACEDILQEIFLQLWVKRDNLQIRESLKGYLLTACRYQVFHYIRKTPARQDLFINLEERLTAPSSDHTLLQKDLSKQIDKIVCGLPEKCRQIYRLSREEYLSHREIAQKLNISTKTVENQLTIALRRLRLSLGECFFFDHSSF
jgi:RNA polymerase sigma-70 factor (ECF subfamily)